MGWPFDLMSGSTARRGRRRSSLGDRYPPPGLSRQLPPTSCRGAPLPDLQRKPGGSAREWPVRKDESSSLQAAVRAPRPKPWPGAQKATHTVREAGRLGAPGQEQQHSRGGHCAAPPPAWRPLLAERRRPPERWAGSGEAGRSPRARETRRAPRVSRGAVLVNDKKSLWVLISPSFLPLFSV